MIKSFRINIIFIILLFIICGTIFYTRCSIQPQLSDDLLYKFVLDRGSLGYNASYEREVKSISDAIVSQSYQYRSSNGRFPIHVMVQMFAGPWGWHAFAIFNTFLFLLTIYFTGCLVINEDNRYNVLYWIIIFIGYFYLYQANGILWYSIAGSFNYLLPIFLITAFLIIFKKVRTKRINTKLLPLLWILSLFTGWSHESYSLPLAGGIFIWLLLNKHELNKCVVSMAIPLWLGCMALILAPGNFSRMGAQPDHWFMFKRAISYFLHTWYMWLFILLSCCLIIKNKKQFISYIKGNSLVCYSLIIACLFGCYVNTLAQSFNGISFYFALLDFGLLGFFLNINSSKCISSSLSFLLIACLIVHQYRIIDYDRKLIAKENLLIQDYIKSKDGNVNDINIFIPNDVRPFVNDRFHSVTKDWQFHVIYCAYSNKQKPLHLQTINSKGEAIVEIFN